MSSLLFNTYINIQKIVSSEIFPIFRQQIEILISNHIGNISYVLLYIYDY